ncbi:MAG: hypothetical protein IH614_01100 [Desulfuromonadales bacterium]|nr:hypothetical protein [Desulfuromonadales bacterium]
MRRSDLFAIFLLVCTLLFVALLGYGELRQERDQAGREGNARLVRTLGLTDLALFTEARYTRHLSQADHHAPFQDHPLALEHFPSGSMVSPPLPWRRPL